VRAALYGTAGINQMGGGGVAYRTAVQIGLLLSVAESLYADVELRLGGRTKIVGNRSPEENIVHKSDE
jgi:hypothetical protein